MPAKPQERQYRMLSVPLTIPNEQNSKRFDSNYYVEGYASTFNDPYVLYSFDEYDVYEVIDPAAFAETDMRDVIMQYDHRGHVYARMSNGTLLVEPDDHGLFIAADLSKSQASRDLYEEIANGLTTRMSWAFTVGASEYDKDTHTSRITRVKRIYDVSAVSLPADPNTEISARSFDDGVIVKAHEEFMRARDKKARAIALAEITRIMYEGE